MTIFRFTRWSALSIAFVSQLEPLGHLLVRGALEVHAQRVRLERREAGAEAEDEALQLVARDHRDRRIVDVRPGQRIAERAVRVGILPRRCLRNET